MVKWKRGERDGGEWLTGAHIQNIRTFTFQLKQRNTRKRCLLMWVKARKARKARINGG